MPCDLVPELPSCPLQALKTRLLRKKEKVLNSAVCPGEKSHWDVRAPVMSGNGKCAVLLGPALRSEPPHLQESPLTKEGKRSIISRPPIPSELGFSICVF